jgi:hypothetical protein
VYLRFSDAELKKVVVSLPSVLGYNHDNLVQEKLEPLQAYLGLSDAELRKVVVSSTAVLSCNHDSLVQEKLEPMMRVLDYTLDQLKDEVVAQGQALSYGYIDEKWAIMISRFAEEEDDGKVKALRRLKPRGLGVGMARLARRLADLDMLGSKPKASEWFRRLVMHTDAQWNDIPEIHGLREACQVDADADAE